MIKLFIMFFLFCQNVFADDGFSVGIKLLGSDWSRDTKVSPGEVQQKSNQMSFSLMYQNNRFFTAVNLQGGNFKFNNTTPDRITLNGANATSSDTVIHGEFDLLAGYYFFDRTAFFIDIKSTSDKWQNEAYQQNFNGIGLGVSTYYPINKQWLIYGSFGVIGNGVLVDVDGIELAQAKSSALEFAVSHTLNASSSLAIGIKSRYYTYTLNDLSEQAYLISGVFINYQYAFSK